MQRGLYGHLSLRRSRRSHGEPGQAPVYLLGRWKDCVELPIAVQKPPAFQLKVMKEESLIEAIASIRNGSSVEHNPLTELAVIAWQNPKRTALPSTVTQRRHKG